MKSENNQLKLEVLIPAASRLKKLIIKIHGWWKEKPDLFRMPAFWEDDELLSKGHLPVLRPKATSPSLDLSEGCIGTQEEQRIGGVCQAGPRADILPGVGLFYNNVIWTRSGPPRAGALCVFRCLGA